MADRPILFSAPMVRALLDGRKSQTRRVLTGKSGITAAHRVERYGQAWMACEYDRRWPLRLPYAPGDRLWVREAWSHIGHGVWTISAARMAGKGGVIYRAGHGEQDGSGPRVDAKWWPGIHMPREFSRLTLLVTDVRVQRLQDISEADARAEGFPITWDGEPYDPPSPDVDSWQGYGRASMCLYWNQLHGPDAWAENPWVAAITFEVVRANIDKVTA